MWCLRYSRDIPRQPDNKYHFGSLHGGRAYLLIGIVIWRLVCGSTVLGNEQDLSELFEVTKSRSFNKRNEAKYLQVAANEGL